VPLRSSGCEHSMLDVRCWMFDVRSLPSRVQGPDALRIRWDSDFAGF
jgi:hypothetical protein